MAREALAREAKKIMDRIAELPRAAGTEGEARARKYCAEYLTRAGFVVTEEDFDYSPLPGKWAVPVLGLLALAWFVMLGAAPGRAVPKETVQASLPLLLLMGAVYFVAARAIRRPRHFLRRATNLVATRGGVPRIWLMAHLDSKSQSVPMLVRIAGIVVASAAMLLTIVVAFTPAVFNLGDAFWIPVTVAGAAGSVAVVLSTVGNRSRGAVDNASGVAAVLLTAAHAAPDARVGVLVTSAEELGLAGAWAWVRDQSDRHVSPHFRHAINFDGVDDVGELTCMSNSGNSVAGAMRTVASASQSQMTFRRVLPGIMVDANALNESGWDAVTISKGNFATLARIHTPADHPGRLTGHGVAEAVELVMNFIQREI